VYFVWISEQTGIISLFNINWLVLITETHCVYCAVRTEPLNATLRFRLLFTGKLIQKLHMRLK